MADCKTGKRMMVAAERRNLAVELRKAGLSYQKIGDQLGISRQSAFKAVKKALQEIEASTIENATELIRIELERLDDYQIRVTQEIKSGNALQAIDRALRIMDRRAKLLGLDLEVGSPQRPWVGRAMTADDVLAILNGVDDEASSR